MKLRLHVSSLPASKAEVDFACSVVRVGRNPESELSLQGTGTQAVSWNHARIELSPAGAYVSDLQSSNHTFVNDQQISARTAVREGDTIRLGQSGPALKVLAVELSGNDRAEKSAPRNPLSPRESKQFDKAETARRFPSTTRMMIAVLQQKHRKLLTTSGVIIASLLIAVGLLAYFLLYHQPSPPPTIDHFYVLSIGVSKYKDADFNLEYADKDAEAIFKAFDAQNATNFKPVTGDVLLNQEATRDNILSHLDKLPTKVTQNSLAIISLSGHGLKDANNFFFYLPHDYDPKRHLASTGISWDDIRRPLSALDCQVLIIMDTCHSGAIARNGMVGNQEELKNSVSVAFRDEAKNKKGMVILTACRADGKAQESSDWGHGLLSLALLEGMTGERLYGKKQTPPLPKPPDGVLILKALNGYITQRVKDVGGGEQAIVTHKAGNVSLDYVPIGKLK